MRAVVVYESMFGNTRAIAQAIGAGLSESFDVTVIPVARASSAAQAQGELVVVGGPTHAHGLSRRSTRQAAAKQAAVAGSGLRLEPDTLDSGLREWLAPSGSGKSGGMAAAFDTRLHGPAAFTGRASKSIGRALRARGYDLVIRPESFIVTKRNELWPGEEDRARAWGAALALSCSLSLERSGQS